MAENFEMVVIVYIEQLYDAVSYERKVEIIIKFVEHFHIVNEAGNALCNMSA